ncbi:exonuclease domain-containing protein [Acetobacterium wieringae]|uniref:exonuclease domain-containing protein n=1 Tax=Acetobacterium wieringae TaxID=52694 RepID=UPI002033694E|nr:exonuclease domain-containing protein [Acetobacterium wieringae]URN84987.1 exonuclease [Acetobacterium wieringae]
MSRSNPNSIIAFPNEFVVLDIETTGLSPTYDSIIEISALRVRDGIVISKFSSLTKPTSYFMPLFPKENKTDYLYTDDGEPYYYVCDFISDLTGITNAMLADAPDLKDVLEDFSSFILDSIVVGHNVSFDVNFLKHNFRQLFDRNIEITYVDTMRIARKIFSEERHHRLIDVTNYLSIILDDSKLHRSLYDCEVTLNCYQAMYDMIPSKYDTHDNFIDLFNRRTRSNFDPRNLSPESEEIDDSNPFFNKECIFTGSLDKMVRKEAQQIVVNLGGTCGKTVTQKQII